MAALRFGVEVNRYNPLESGLARLFRLLESHCIDTVIDVGASDGSYGHLLRRGGYRGAILSFEPLESEHRRLQEAAKHDDKWFVAPRMALGNESGVAQIHVAGNSSSSSLLPMNRRHESAAPHSKYITLESAPVSRLDEFDHATIQSARSIFLKVDAQGYEMPVLLGAEQLLSRVRGIQIELSLVELYDGQALYIEVIEWLGGRGLELWGMLPGFVDPHSARLLQFDGLFFRSAD